MAMWVLDDSPARQLGCDQRQCRDWHLGAGNSVAGWDKYFGGKYGNRQYWYWNRNNKQCVIGVRRSRFWDVCDDHGSGRRYHCSGNVGIGSTAPGQTLDVTGTVRAIGFTMSGQTPMSGYVDRHRHQRRHDVDIAGDFQRMDSFRE